MEREPVPEGPEVATKIPGESLIKPVQPEPETQVIPAEAEWLFEDEAEPDEEPVDPDETQVVDDDSGGAPPNRD